MKSTLATALALSAALICGGCAESPLEQSGGSDAASPAKGRPLPPRAIIEWDDSFAPMIAGQIVPAGIVGDGRAADGAETGISVYEGAVCGVHAAVETSLSFDMYNATTCGAPRVLQFYFAGRSGPVKLVQSKTYTRDIGDMAVGETTTEPFQGFNTGDEPNCSLLRYGDDYPGTNSPIRTRLPDAPNGARRWRVESTGSHRGQCRYAGKGGKEILGPLMPPMPFAYTITEVK